jgi:hypothetical protein
MRRLIGALILGLGLWGCNGVQPDIVIQSLEHEIEDLQLYEAQFVPMLPDEVDEATGKPLPLLWRNRFRSSRLAMEGLLAWAKDEKFDVIKRRAELLGEE